MDRQTLRDWVHRFKGSGPEKPIDGMALGQPNILNRDQKVVRGAARRVLLPPRLGLGSRRMGSAIRQRRPSPEQSPQEDDRRYQPVTYLAPRYPLWFIA